MPTFDIDDPDPGPDLRLALGGPVTMFFRASVLEETQEWLAAHGYDVVTVDAEAWVSPGDMQDAMAMALSFPDYYGRNLDALNDCLSDVAAGAYGTTESATGLVLVILRFDAFAHREPVVAHALCDIFATQARGAALFGRRMMCLLQSDDPRLTIPPVGSSPVLWNPAEWLDSKRT